MKNIEKIVKSDNGSDESADDSREDAAGSTGDFAPWDE
jgi:hypothetical protein